MHSVQKIDSDIIMKSRTKYCNCTLFISSWWIIQVISHVIEKFIQPNHFLIQKGAQKNRHKICSSSTEKREKERKRKRESKKVMKKVIVKNKNDWFTIRTDTWVWEEERTGANLSLVRLVGEIRWHKSTDYAIMMRLCHNTCLWHNRINISVILMMRARGEEKKQKWITLIIKLY